MKTGRIVALAMTALVGCNIAAAEERASAAVQTLADDFELVATTAEIELDAVEFEALAPTEPVTEPVTAAEAVAPMPANPRVTAEPFVVADAPTPIAYRTARQKRTVYAKPDASSPIRGRVPMGRTFAILGYVDGAGCSERWADVGNAGYVCLEETRAAGKNRPTLEPKMYGHNGLTPFYYAQNRKGEQAPRWRSLKAYARGDVPRDHLAAGTDYAFTSRLMRKGEVLLVDARGLVVREKDVKRFRPSRFEGRKLAESPVPEGKRVAWVVSWPEATAYTQPDPEAEAFGPVDYHTELLVDAKPFVNEHGSWHHLPNGGWARDKDLRVWSAPRVRPDGVGDGELWIDVDLEQQILTAMVGEEPVFVTMISSGHKGPTPKGMFRIRTKQAVGSMSSGPDADDFYDVEAVPFVQYFAGSIALHGAYWHNYFGKPISHGCVNLSPKDSKYVFSLTSPDVPAGWIHAFETEANLGTAVIVRRGDRPVDDRREPARPLFGA